MYPPSILTPISLKIFVDLYIYSRISFIHVFFAYLPRFLLIIVNATREVEFSFTLNRARYYLFLYVFYQKLCNLLCSFYLHFQVLLAICSPSYYAHSKDCRDKMNELIIIGELNSCVLDIKFSQTYFYREWFMYKFHYRRISMWVFEESTVDHIFSIRQML